MKVALHEVPGLGRRYFSRCEAALDGEVLDAAALRAPAPR
jgi:hypothetical protein